MVCPPFLLSVYCLERRREYCALTYSPTTGIHLVPAGDEQLAREGVQAYLEPLRVSLNLLLASANASKPSTPMFMLATGGMRGIDDDLRGRLEQAINESTFFHNEFQIHNYQLATGVQEALYGWMTANYSLARFENRNFKTYGFVEMGGQSLQIAFEIGTRVDAGPDGEAVDLTINFQQKQRVFRVFTKMNNQLGAQAARSAYLNNLVGNQEPCSLLAQDFLAPNAARVGSALAIGNPTLQASAPGDRVIRLTESVVPVFRLLGCNLCNPAARCQNCPAKLRPLAPPLLHDGPGMRFVGGSSFWHATKALHQGRVRQEHSFAVSDFRHMIIQFALRDWANHQAQVTREVEAEIRAMTSCQVHAQIPGNGTLEVKTDILRTSAIARAIKHLRNALFAGILVYTTLYDGVGLPPGTTATVPLHIVQGVGEFHPFNGVVGLHVDGPSLNVPYSWTLGRALIHVVGATVAVSLTPYLIASPC